MTKRILTCIILALVTSYTVQARNYYVADPRGSDGIAGSGDDVNSSDAYTGTLTQPFATITKACTVARAGDTVLIMGGVYNQTLRPQFSGKTDSIITYKNFNTSEVKIINTPGLSDLTPDEEGADQEGRQYGIYLYGLSYISIRGVSVTEVSGWLRAVRCSHITVQGNKFTKASSTGTTGSVKFLYSDKNNVIDNTIHDGNDNLLLIHSDSNLIAGNNMMKGRHSIWCIRAGNFNVIRNNYFHNEIQKIGEIYDAENDSPFVYDATKYNLVESNQFAKTASSGDASPYAGIQFAGQRCIIRKNLFYETIGPAFDLTLYSDEARYNYENRVYHNVFYKTDFAGVSIAGSTAYTFYDNILKNNIFYQSVFVANDKRWTWYTDELEGKAVQVLTGRKDGFIFENNNFYNQAPDESYLITYGDRTSTSNPPQHEVSWWQTNSPVLFKGNIEKDPLFVNAPAHDFLLQQGSQMIDAGTFLTRTKGAGNSTVLPVADVKYFYSGFGIAGEAGDLIQLAGQSQTAYIVGINYDSSLLVLDQKLTWVDSQGVSLCYKGNGPDLGAFEYGTTALHDSYNGSHFSKKSATISAYINTLTGNGQITFFLYRTESVRIGLFCTNGKRIHTIELGKQPAGTHTITFSKTIFGKAPLPSGIVIVMLESKTTQSQNRLLYIQ